MKILTSFQDDETTLSLAELSRRAELPKSTTHRLLKELGAWGIVETTESGVTLGMRMFELGQLVPRQRELREVTAPILDKLHRDTGLAVHLAVLQETEVLYLDKLITAGGPQLPSRVGGRMPAYCTAVGKAMLAFSGPHLIDRALRAAKEHRTTGPALMTGMLARELDVVRTKGFALDREESTRGVVCVAVPIMGEAGQVIAAISVSGWSPQIQPARIVPLLRAAAAASGRAACKPAAV